MAEPVEPPPSPPAQTQPPRRRSVLGRLLRILLVLILLAAVGLGIYLGWPVVYERYIRPVAANTAELASLQERLGEAESRLLRLESQAATVEDADALADELTEHAARVDAVVDRIEDHTRLLEELDREAAELAAAAEAADASLTRELTLLRSMALLSRARLFLFQANYGLAGEDLRSARSLLAGLEQPADEDTVIADILFRIDLALSALPDRPVAAADDLDIAWQLLLGDVPPSPPTTGPADTTTTTTTATTTTTS